MKKFLLILILIPTFIQAEELGFICNGETRNYDFRTKQTTSKKSSEDIVITDTYLRYQGLKYYSGIDFDRDTKVEYFAHYDGVSFSNLEILGRFHHKLTYIVFH